MRPRTLLRCALAAAALAGPAEARDDRLLLTIDGALASPAAQDRLDDTVQFAWGDAPHLEPLQALGIHTVTRKTFAPIRTDLEACDRAFLAAVIALRDRAKEVGANAVVGIKSMYKNREFRSETQYECRAGHVSTSVSLEGRLVTLPRAGVTPLVPAVKR